MLGPNSVFLYAGIPLSLKMLHENNTVDINIKTIFMIVLIAQIYVLTINTFEKKKFET